MPQLSLHTHQSCHALAAHSGWQAGGLARPHPPAPAIPRWHPPCFAARAWLAGILTRVVRSIEPPGLLRGLRSAYYAATSAADRLLPGPSRGEAFWGAMLRLSWGRPLLYLYSADDPLADGAKISELVAEKRRRGHGVRARCWGASEHVSHLRHHREEYTRLLLGLLAEASAAAAQQQARPCGGSIEAGGGSRAAAAIGSGGSGGSQGAALPLRSRL